MTDPTLLELTVDPHSADYRAGFCAGFLSPRGAVADPKRSFAYRVGHQHGDAGPRVPSVMFWRDGEAAVRWPVAPTAPE